MRLGFKQEYYAKKLHQTPSHWASTLFQMTLSRPDRASTCEVRAFRRSDLRDLRRVYMRAFRNSMYLADYRSASFVERARCDVFEHADSPRIGQSQVALVRGQVVGAAFVDESAAGPLLSPIFVHPHNQRRGIAGSLLREVIRSLLSEGETILYSECHLGNQRSWNWHRACGFEEVPGAGPTYHRARFFDHELKRALATGKTGAHSIAELEKLASFWDGERKRMWEIEHRDFEAAHPQFRLWPRPRSAQKTE